MIDPNGYPANSVPIGGKIANPLPYQPGYVAPSSPSTTQGGIMQTTSTMNAKDNTTSSAIDTKIAKLPVPAYGSTFYDPKTGNPQGINKFDPNTGKPSDDPNAGGASGGGAPAGPKSPDGQGLSLSAPTGFKYTLPALTPEQVTAGVTRQYSPDGHVYQVDSKGVATPDPVGEQDYQANVEAKTKEDAFTAVLDTYKVGLDAAHTALIDGIKTNAAEQIRLQTDLNARTLAGKTVAGFRTGATEYTPEIEMGILKNEQEQGMAKLAKINTDLNLALAQAESSKADKDFELATKALDTVNALEKDKKDTIQQVYKNYADAVTLLNTQKKEAQTIKDTAHTNAVKDLTTAAPALVKAYDSLKPADQQTYLDALAKKTGLDTSLILGEMDKSRLATKNTTSTIDKRNQAPKPKAPTTPKDFFTPTSKEKSIVAGFMVNHPEVDKARLKTDSGYFYWTLEQANNEPVK